MPTPEAIAKLLARLDDAGLSAYEREVLERIAEQYFEILELLQEPGVTMAEIRKRFGSNRERG